MLEDAQISYKLGTVASEVLGVSGRLMLKALVEGQTEPEELTELAQGRLRSKKPQLRKALDGEVRAYHRFQLELLLKHLDECEAIIAKLDQQIGESLKPYEEVVERLDEVPGVDRISAAVVLAEIGPEVSHWEDSRQLACWGCLCPGNHETASKRLSGRTRQGNRWLRRGFCEMNWAASRKKGSYFKAQYHRLAGHRGKQRAVLAGAHTLITVVYHLLKHPGLRYRELGEDHFDKRDAQRTAQQLVKRLAKLGYEVQLTPKAA